MVLLVIRIPFRVELVERTGEAVPSFFVSGNPDIVFAHGIGCRIIGNDHVVCETQVAPDENVEDLPDRVGCPVRPVEMVLVGDEHDRDMLHTRRHHAAVHRIAHHAIVAVVADEPADVQRRQDQVEREGFRVPEGLFQAEKPILPFETDLAADPVQARTPVLVHEIMRLAITGKMDRVPLLLHVMPEMETAGGVPESLTADDKEDLHCSFLRDMS